MSWLSRITNQKLIITTGSGEVFEPIWVKASKSRELNATRFEFNEVEGTLVKRGKVNGLVFPYQLYFQGDNSIEEGERFDQATRDTRPWLMSHPKYEDILVQPASININDDNQNVTIVTGEFWETIEDTYPEAKISVQESILDGVDQTTETSASDYNKELGTPEASSLSTITQTIEDVSQKFRDAAITAADLENVENAISEVNSALDSITTDATTFMRNYAYLARTPARYYNKIINRITLIKSAYDDLKLSVTALLSRQNKQLFESLGSNYIAGLAESAVLYTSEIAEDQGIENNIIADYETRKEVLGVIEDINNSLDDFIDTIGDFQTENDSTPDSYTPQPDTITELKNVISQATGQLLQIAVEAKQERIYSLPEDLGIIPLVHRLYGNTNDETINSFTKANEIKLMEWLQLKKGREVIYYI